MATSHRRTSDHPGLRRHQELRAQSLQNRVADTITSFAGSMWFVYIHVVWFAAWILFGVEEYPFGLLTMIVSLEAIFLSTFVMITQNRQDEARKHVVEEEYRLVQLEKEQNDQLIDLSTQILDLTRKIDELTRAHARSD